MPTMYKILLSIFGIAWVTQSFAQEPPLLDRQLFFGNPEIAAGELSPDGRSISFLKAYNGIMNVWVKDFDAPFSAARPITNSDRPLFEYSWTEDSKYILYARDKDGDENLNVYAVDPYESTQPGILPESRNLTPIEGVAAEIIHVSQKNPDLIWVGLNQRDEAWHDLYQLQISTGNLKRIYENIDRITGYEFDWDDQLRLLSRTDEEGSTTLLRKDGNQLTPIFETFVTENAAVLGWDEKNEFFYLMSNKGNLDLSAVFKVNPSTGELKYFESDPEKRVDFGGLQLDRNTRRILSTSYVDDRVRYYWKDPIWEANYTFLREKFPGREVTFQSATHDYSKFLVALTGDKVAAEAWFFDAKSRQLIHQYTARPDLKAVEQHLAPMLPIRFPSSDGLEIPAYLTLPVGKEPRNLPLIVLVHGGPKGPRDLWGYDPEVQFLANRGYAVLQPNFRSSGGYGKKFLNAGDLQWGKLMQDDITWGVRYVIENGFADPKRIGIMGGSYGGYATLAGLTFTPELYACGVDIVGPSNIFTLLDSIPAYWESGRAFLYGMVGNPDTAEGRALIEQASPLFSANKIIKPLLIVQGANDPRVKQAEADQIVIALRDRGHDVSYLLAEDEGHGFAKPVNRMAMYAEVERFLASKLGGRYQTDLPADIALRLSELKVDLTKVQYINPKEVAIANEFPAFEPKIAPGKEAWEVEITLQGQNLSMKTERTIERIRDGWLIRDTTQSPLGNFSDEETYTHNLFPIARKVIRAGQTISVRYAPGQIEIQEGDKTQSIPFQGALLTDGPGRHYVLASLPLDSEKPLAVMVSDITTLKVSPSRIQIEGSEKLNGKPFLRISLTNLETPAQATHLWLDPTTRRIERIEQVIPSLGNAKLTMQRSKQ
ncbi:MAG: S9 family peptidase [Planctomycetota bacterium]